ncbi:MAG: hypothetical protein AVDCRST_MAG34-542, partial [uncultured Nocardioidaceae bacterium]
CTWKGTRSSRYCAREVITTSPSRRRAHCRATWTSTGTPHCCTGSGRTPTRCSRTCRRRRTAARARA